MSEHLLSALGDLKNPSANIINQTRVLEMCARPTNPIIKTGLVSAWQKFRLFFLGEFEMCCNEINGFRKFLFFAVSSELQKWQHDTLKVRDSHIQFGSIVKSV